MVVRLPDCDLPSIPIDLVDSQRVVEDLANCGIHEKVHDRRCSAEVGTIRLVVILRLALGYVVSLEIKCDGRECSGYQRRRNKAGKDGVSLGSNLLLPIHGAAVFGVLSV
jgi:hypothetical protein